MKILSILGASKKDIANRELERKGKALKRSQDKLVDELEAKKDDAQAVVDNLLNVTTETVNEETWATEYQAAKVELVLVEQELSIARETLKEYF